VEILCHLDLDVPVDVPIAFELLNTAIAFAGEVEVCFEVFLPLQDATTVMGPWYVANCDHFTRLNDSGSSNSNRHLLPSVPDPIQSHLFLLHYFSPCVRVTVMSNESCCTNEQE